jgi:hypothetical protein
MKLASPDYLFTSKGFVKDHCFVFDEKVAFHLLTAKKV